jgi:hypothetical protein
MALDFAALCERGQAADILLNTASYDEADAAYMSLYQDMRADGVVDLYVASKLVLGLLLSWLETRQVDRAFKLWTSRPSDDLGEGIYGIEHGYTSAHDRVVYDIVSAFFHSLSAEDVGVASSSVNQLMQRVCEYAREEDPLMLGMALSDWKQFLMHLHGQYVPPEIAQPVLEEMERYGRAVPLEGVEFPPPDAWKKQKG